MTQHATLLGLNGEALDLAIAKVSAAYGEDHGRLMPWPTSTGLLLGEQLQLGWTSGA